MGRVLSSRIAHPLPLAYDRAHAMSISDPNAARAPGLEFLRPIVEPHLEKVLSSGVFKSADRLRDLLRFAVDETLEGRGDELKEYVLGATTLGSGDSFDSPKPIRSSKADPKPSSSRFRKGPTRRRSESPHLRPCRRTGQRREVHGWPRFSTRRAARRVRVRRHWTR